MSEGPTSQQPGAEGPLQGQDRATESRSTWRSEELLGDRNEVLIQHHDEVYRLRRTRQGKLILYK